MKTFSLLVYVEIPETTRLFLIPNDQLTEDLKKDLELAHGWMMNHINCENDGSAKEIAALHITDATATSFRDNLYPYCGWLKQFELDNLIDSAGKLKPIQLNITNVYHCGWFL